MSYEDCCNEMYLERLRAKEVLNAARVRFRMSQLKKHEANQTQIPNKIIEPTKREEFSFTMPEVLPDNIDKLKWLIFKI